MPPAVSRELRSHKSPVAVQKWAAELPLWCRVVELVPKLELAGRGAGEREAIRLCVQTNAEYLLIDDQRGRANALQTTSAKPLGTIAVLYEMSLRETDGHLLFEQWMLRLRETNFYFSASLDRSIERLKSKF